MVRLCTYLSTLCLAFGHVIATPTPVIEDEYLPSHVEVEARQTTHHCSKEMHVMVASGCSAPCASDTPNLLAPLLDLINSSFPHSGQYFVPYNNSITKQAIYSTPLMIKAAKKFHRNCPNTPIVFVGYSLGGIVIMNTLCGLSTGSLGIPATMTSQVIAAVVYGEETRAADQPYNVGSCTNGAPTFARNDTAQCAPFAPIIRSWCDATDPQCCAGGTNFTQHYQYMAEYDTTAISFISTQLASYRAQKTAAP